MKSGLVWSAVRRADDKKEIFLSFTVTFYMAVPQGHKEYDGLLF